MSIVFSDNFDSLTPGQFAGWLSGWIDDFSPAVVFGGIQQRALHGTNFTNCAVCGGSGIRRWFSTPYPSQGAIRCQIAAMISTIPVGAEIFALEIIDRINAIIPLQAFQVLLSVRGDGSLRVRIPDVFFGVSFFANSVAGVFPTDGTWFALQMRIISIKPTVHLEFEVNNVNVWSITHTPTDAFTADQWDCLGMHNVSGQAAIPAVANPKTVLVAYDNYEGDDSSALINYPLTPAPPIDPNTCTSPPTVGMIIVQKVVT